MNLKSRQFALYGSLYSCLILTSSQAFGQATESQITLAQTDIQVENLVQHTDNYYANFKVNSKLNFANKRVTKQYRRAKVKAWTKADFDGNGRLDLLITGTHHDGKSKVICLLDMGAGKLVLEPFDRQFYRACPIATVSYKGPQPIIEYADFAEPFLTEKLQDKQSFRLVYKYGGFIEYNPYPLTQALLDSIVYESTFAYHKVTEEKMTLAGSGQATYCAEAYPVLEENSKTYVLQKTTITAQALNTIQGLASYMANQPLKSVYRIGFNHIPHTTLTISYRGGQRLRVRDEGEIGAFSLMRLYTLLGQLHKSQSWQSSKP